MKVSLEAALKQSRDLGELAAKKEHSELTPLKTLELFRKMRKDEVGMLLMDSDKQTPADLLVEFVMVPPTCIRPTVKVGGDKTNEDDMTIKVYEILKQNNFLGHCIKEGRDMFKIHEGWSLLQNIYTQYINSETSGLPKELVGKNSTKGIIQRLKGKTGRFRGNLSGKRVEFSARTVITPDPNLRIEQVGVPRQMALVLTYAEKVNSRNIKRLKLAVKNGPSVYPGANYISRKWDPNPLSLAFLANKKVVDTIAIGDVVHRHLVDGDVVLFNRQPSLHKLSIMGFRAKVMDHRTLRFNECACTPFNADFDGDEMNIHLPQTEEAKAEVIHLMGSVENIINPKNGGAIISLTQDFLTCAFLISNKDTFFSRSEFCRVCSYFCDADEAVELPVPAILKPVGTRPSRRALDRQAGHFGPPDAQRAHPAHRQHRSHGEKLQQKRRPVPLRYGRRIVAPADAACASRTPSSSRARWARAPWATRSKGSSTACSKTTRTTCPPRACCGSRS